MAFAAGVLLSPVLYAAAPFIGDMQSSLGINAHADTETPVPQPDDEALLEAAFEVAGYLKNRDFSLLSTWVHPEKGVIFVPFSTVEPDKNLSFTSAQIKNFESDSVRYIWGVFHGSGDPIKLTPADYIDRFVYNEDYINAPMLGRNRVLGLGNSIENVTKAFADASFIEFYFPGFEARYEGIDWCGLKLVFETYNDRYFLVAVIHSEWTI